MESSTFPTTGLASAIAAGDVESNQRLALELSEAAALAEGQSPFAYSVHVYDPQWLRGRREIESFFIGEVDRDNLVEGRSVAELARTHGVHRSWIYKLLARYREGGYEALERAGLDERGLSGQPGWRIPLDGRRWGGFHTIELLFFAE